MREDWVNFSTSFLWLCKGLELEKRSLVGVYGEELME